MSFLVRKIARSKWELEEEGPVNADAITNCLKTTGNTLSFWRVESESDIGDAVLALAAANDNLDKMDVVVIPESVFINLKIPIEKTSGKTACTALVHTHRDLAKLNIHHLALVSDVMRKK